MNVILAMSDSFRRDHIGAFGNPWIKTPALDRFVSQSTAFPNFRMGSYATIPQRTDMHTGRFCYAYRPWQALEPDDVVLAEVLAAKGIATYCSADTPHLFHSAKMTFMRGFHAFHWTRGSEVDRWWTDDYNERDFQPPTGQGRIRFNEKRYMGIVAPGRDATARDGLDRPPDLPGRHRVTDAQLPARAVLPLRRRIRPARAVGPAALGDRSLRPRLPGRPLHVGGIRVGAPIRPARTAADPGPLCRRMHAGRPLVRAADRHRRSARPGPEHDGHFH